MTNANTLERLRRNDRHMDSIHLQIHSGSDNSATAVVEALGQATKVSKVAVSFYQLYSSPFLPPSAATDATATANSSSRKRSRSEVAQPDLMETIGSLPKLQELSCSAGLTVHALPVSSLLSVLREATQLESIQLSRIQLQGCALDFEAFANSLRAHTSLRNFSLQDCKLVFNDASSSTQSFALDTILKALAILPTLESVQVTTKDLCMGILTPEAVELLCSSSSLQKLILKGFAWNAKHVVAMGPGVATSKTLKHLVLPTYNGIASPKVLDCLAFMLQDNTCLEHFEMPTLQEGAIPWIPVATKIVQTNTQLQVLKLGGLTNATNPSIRMHLKLNQAGRSQLMSGAGSTNNSEWVQAMGKVAQDLDCMFYFLSQNPSLCEC